MLTDRGWAVLGAGLALAILWILLGEIELLGGAAILLTAVVLAIFYVRAFSPTVGVVRRLTPTHVHEGDKAYVEVSITNLGRRPIGNVTLEDSVGVLGSAEFGIGWLQAGQPAQTEYQIVCRPRGAYKVGPMALSVTDPVGLASSSATAGTVDRLVVFPAVEDLRGFPMTRGRDPSMQASRPEHSQHGGEDFYTLREYIQGDDLRFVHWPSSAKMDELMIRQLETPWQSRALVMMDVRERTYENLECFEKAVKGAASVVRHLAQSGFDAELWAGGTSTIGLHRYTDAMEQLATIERVDRLDLRGVAARLQRTGRGGVLVIVTGVHDHDVLEAQRLLSREYRTTIVLAASETASANSAALNRGGAFTMAVRPGDSWATAWSNLTERTWRGSSLV